MLLLLILFLSPFLVAQSPSSSQAGASKADHSQEAVVIEQFTRKEKFETDGTSLREDTARVRIQSEAGVQKYGVLSFSFASGTGRWWKRPRRTCRTWLRKSLGKRLSTAICMKSMWR